MVRGMTERLDKFSERMWKQKALTATKKKIRTIVFVLRRFEVSQRNVREVFDVNLWLSAEGVPPPQRVVASLLLVRRLLRRGALQARVETPREAPLRTHSHSCPDTTHVVNSKQYFCTFHYYTFCFTNSSSLTNPQYVFTSKNSDHVCTWTHLR